MAIANSQSLPAIYGGEPAFPERFRFVRPTLPELDAVMRLYAPQYSTGLITNSNLVDRLESAVAERIGVQHCIAVSSGTSALMLVLRALDLAGEIIVPSFTFFATVHAAVWNGLTPVLADCDANSWNIDPNEIERLVTPRTEAILAVHLYGNPCRVDALTQAAAQHHLKLIFDAAHALGSRYGGAPIGRFGDAEVFSLTPTKLLIGGEGGLITTNDATLARRLRAARNYGDSGDYDPDLLGLNARMPEFNAALALAGLDAVDAKVAAHNCIAQRYKGRLAEIEGFSFQQIDSADQSAYKDFSVHIDAASFGMTRDDLAQALLAENIETRKYFSPALHQQKLYRDLPTAAREHLPNTEPIANGVLSLPIYPALPDESVDTIAWAIARIARAVAER